MTSSKILNWTTRVKRRGHCHFAFCCNILHILCVQVFGVLKLSCEPMLNPWYYDFIFFLASEKTVLAKISGSKITWPRLPTWKFVHLFWAFICFIFAPRDRILLCSPSGPWSSSPRSSTCPELARTTGVSHPVSIRICWSEYGYLLLGHTSLPLLALGPLIAHY